MSVIIEAQVIVIEWEDTPISREDTDHGEHGRHRHVVHIYNELDGHTYRIHARDETLVSKVVAKFMEKIHRTQQPGDKLFCDGGCSDQEGEDVFQFAHLTVEQYLHKAHCPDLKWTFVGDTGGA